MTSPFDIKDEMMRGAVAKALLDSVTPETRDQLMISAISNLMKPQKNTRGYGDDEPSILQSAYNTAAYQIANQTAREWLEKDENFRAKIRDLLAKVTERFFASPEALDGLAEKMASAMTEAFRKTNY